MRKVILNLAMSLDGFIEGPNGEIDWCIMDEEMNFESFLNSVDAIFYGKVTYDLWGQFDPENTVTDLEKKIWTQVHKKEKYVFTTNPGDDVGVTYISTDIAQKVAEIKNRDGKDIWLYGGANLVTTFVDKQLIDVYQISVHPVILGKGKPMFADIRRRVNLVPGDVKRYHCGVTLLTYHAEKEKPVKLDMDEEGTLKEFSG